MKLQLGLGAAILVLLNVAVSGEFGAGPDRLGSDDRIVAQPGGGAVNWAKVPNDAFKRMMDEAMTRMNRATSMSWQSDAPDLNFAMMMVGHHQGAIDMAKAELLYGTDPVLRRLAQEIVITQGEEIAVMRGKIAKNLAQCR